MAKESNGHKEQLKKALEISKGLYKTLVMTSPDAVSATDLEGNFTFVSPQTLAIHGYDSDIELLGKNAAMLIDPKDHPEVAKNFDIVKEKGVLRDIEYTLLRKDGSKFASEMNVSSLKGPGDIPIGYIATIRDVSDKKAMEEHLMQAQKLEALGVLAGRFAHDFNNFLQIIRGYTEAILSSGDCDSFRDELNEIIKAEETAETMIKQLLAFGSKQTLELISININDFIKDLRKTLASSIGKNIKLELDLADNIYIIKADAVQMSQIIINIILNARVAIKDKGEIVIKTRNAIYEDSEYLELSISDTGCGIPDELKDKIFQPFFTTKKQGRGTGLGLSSVYGIVKQNNGHIQFDSEINKGTTFRIYLPRS